MSSLRITKLYHSHQHPFCSNIYIYIFISKNKKIGLTKRMKVTHMFTHVVCACVCVIYGEMELHKSQNFYPDNKNFYSST